MVKLSKLHKWYICGEKEEHVTVHGDLKTSHYAVLDVVKGFCAVFCHNVAFHTGGVRLTGFY